MLWGPPPKMEKENYRMLVLSRHRDEVIVIDDHIKVIVVEIRGDKVRLGVEAPVSVPVHRKEVYEAIVRSHGNQHELRSRQAAIQLHNHLHPESKIEKLEELEHSGQLEMLAVVDVVLGKAVQV